MAKDLGTPLTGHKRRNEARKGRFHFPLARVLFGIIAVLVALFILRVITVDDPDGGRPVEEAVITTTRDGNTIANSVARGPVTITPDPVQMPVGTMAPAGGSSVGTNTPLGQIPGRFGALPDLSEETPNGAIPRKSATGQSPFAAYSRPAELGAAADGPKVAIIVTGLGINEQGSLDAIDTLPDDVTLAFAPYGRSLAATVASARTAGHEVMLEIPLEPFDFPQNDPGPHTLLTGESPRANLDKLFWLMARFGGYFGVINNMGARFTASSVDFAPVMEELGARGIGYLDDGSSNRSVAQQLSSANTVPYGRASMTIDANPARASILAALASLEAQALEYGHAIGIVSALPVSVQTVAEWARELDAKGMALVPASALMK